MTTIFDKITGTSTAFDSESITDSSAEWTEDYYVGWFCVINGDEYKITANTSTTLSFANSLTANADYSIEFIGRDFLEEIESDAANTDKISDDLIAKKYNQVSTDIHNKIYAYLKQSYQDGIYSAYWDLLGGDSFDPMENILNLTCVQQCFAYLLLAKIYQDLAINDNGFEVFKGYNIYQKNYNDGIKDSLAMLQLDLNQDGEASDYEKAHTVSTTAFLGR